MIVTPFLAGSFDLIAGEFLASNRKTKTNKESLAHKRYNPWAEVPLFCAPPGLQNSAPRVSTLGIVHQKRRALKGSQIESPSKAEAGSAGPIVARPDFVL